MYRLFRVKSEADELIGENENVDELLHSCQIPMKYRKYIGESFNVNKKDYFLDDENIELERVLKCLTNPLLNYCTVTNANKERLSDYLDAHGVNAYVINYPDLRNTYMVKEVEKC